MMIPWFVMRKRKKEEEINGPTIIIKKSRNHFIPNCRLSWEVIIIATDWLLSFFIKNTVFSNLKKEWETVS